MFAVTGASGHLGRLVLDALIAEVPASQVVALARDPAKLSDCSKAGVVVRLFNYNEEEMLRPALAGVERLLFISGSEHGQREIQHRHVVEAARNAGVGFIA
jgi:NAD(P)H dehydrogenase (quinone)